MIKSSLNCKPMKTYNLIPENQIEVQKTKLKIKIREKSGILSNNNEFIVTNDCDIVEPA